LVSRGELPPCVVYLCTYTLLPFDGDIVVMGISPYRSGKQIIAILIFVLALFTVALSSQESMKMHIANLLLHLPAYFLAYSNEVLVKDKVMELVRCLKEDVSKSKEEQAILAKLTKAEKAIWQNERIQQRLYRVNELTELINIYTEATLAYLKAFQTVAICVEAVSTTAGII
jgi:hypothetical protein